MAGTQRIKEESLETARLLGHQMTPFDVEREKEISRCKNSACTATIIVEGSEAAGHALTEVCPFMASQHHNGSS